MFFRKNKNKNIIYWPKPVSGFRPRNQNRKQVNALFLLSLLCVLSEPLTHPFTLRPESLHAKNLKPGWKNRSKPPPLQFSRQTPAKGGKIKKRVAIKKTKKMLTKSHWKVLTEPGVKCCNKNVIMAQNRQYGGEKAKRCAFSSRSLPPLLSCDRWFPATPSNEPHNSWRRMLSAPHRSER